LWFGVAHFSWFGCDFEKSVGDQIRSVAFSVTASWLIRPRPRTLWSLGVKSGQKSGGLLREAEPLQRRCNIRLHSLPCGMHAKTKTYSFIVGSFRRRRLALRSWICILRGSAGCGEVFMGWMSFLFALNAEDKAIPRQNYLVLKHIDPIVQIGDAQEANAIGTSLRKWIQFVDFQ